MTRAPDHSYALTEEESDHLTILHVSPNDLRHELLTKWRKQFGVKYVDSLFVKFLAVSKSVGEGVPKAVTTYLVREHEYTANQANRMNLPSIHGALIGAAIAQEPCKGMCADCAYRKGSLPNMSFATTYEAQFKDDGVPFMCHHHMDDNDEPTKVCAGYTKRG